MEHIIALKPDVEPVCKVMQRHSLEEEYVKKPSMSTLIKLKGQTLSVSHWATSNAFLRKKRGDIRILSDINRLNYLTTTPHTQRRN